VVVFCFGSYAAAGHRAFAANPAAGQMSIQIVSPNHAVTVPPNGSITLKVKVSGIVLDPKEIGKKAVPGRGHYHVYIDCIPPEAYTQVAMSRCWAAAFATTTAVFTLSQSAVKIGYGPHTLFVALARNNHILYRAPPAAIQFTVARSNMSIRLLSPSEPITVSPGGKIPLRVQVKGIKLAPHAIGRKYVPGEGHYHVYVDCIQPGAYTRVAMSRCWAAAFATTTAVFKLSESAVKVGRGTHLLLVALARNDHILYEAPAATMVFTVR
jgi:hypothetical protein